MPFKKISLQNYIKIHLKSNPSENKANLEKKLKSSLKDHKNGVKCSCGNDIWVIGSAFVGNSCFTCITGESMPTEDYELEGAIKKRENRKGERHIDNMKPTEIHGFFDDDGYEIKTDLIKKPGLCLTCKYNDDPKTEFLCNMTRFDQQEEGEFICDAYRKK